MKKRVISFALILALVCSFAAVQPLIVPPSKAASNDPQSSAMELFTLGLFKGVSTKIDGSPIFDLERAPTRAEAIVMLIRLLGKENEGWEVVNTALQFERIGAARYARAAVTLDKLSDIARERGLLNDPIFVDRFGEARALCEAARVLVYKVIDLRAKDSPPTADTQLARVLSTQCDNLIGRLALDIFGPDSLEYGSYADANFRLAMTAGVAVGATEVQLNLIASRFLELPKD